MRYLLKCVTGSFSRKLGHILAYIFIACLLLFVGFIIKVKAASVDYSKMHFTTDLAWFNCTGAYTCSPTSSAIQNNTSNGTNFINTWYSYNKLTSYAYRYGLGVSFYVEEGFVSGNIYTVNILLDSPNATFNVLNHYTTVSGTINEHISAIDSNNLNVNFFGTTPNDNGFTLISYTFKALHTGNYFFATFGTTVDTTRTWTFYGYSYQSHGTQVPSANDIKNSLQSSFNNLESSINSSINSVNNAIGNVQNVLKENMNSGFTSIIDKVNNANSAINNEFNSVRNDLENINGSINDVNSNLNNMEQSINNSLNMVEQNINGAINGMASDIDNSINSDDADTSSGKCGIVCKLKGIWTGITNLPSLIWNFMKQGFDAIGDAIGNLFQGIKDLFTPPKGECTKSKNLFNNKTSPHSRSSSVINVEVTDDGFKMSNNGTGTFNGYVSPFKAYIIDTVKNLDGKTLTVSADTSGHYSIGYIYYTSSGWVFGANLDNHTLEVDSSITNGAGNVAVFFTVPYGTSSEYKNVMVNEGSSALSYQPFGEEFCEEGGSLFDWFGNFFKNIVSGIVNLPMKLVELLIEALKNLFVPTDEQLNEIINVSKDLTENFGFVGESIAFFLNIFTALLGLVNANGCVNLPDFTIGATSLFEAHTFWNAQLVCLNDNQILASNIETIRTITSIALVCLFVNFASKKFFSILSKNDNMQASADAADLRGEV